jgi:hypothetical protein
MLATGLLALGLLITVMVLRSVSRTRRFIPYELLIHEGMFIRNVDRHSLSYEKGECRTVINRKLCDKLTLSFVCVRGACVRLTSGSRKARPVGSEGYEKGIT